MAKKLKLTNMSGQRRDVILAKKEGAKSHALASGASVSIYQSEVSKQLQAMLDRPLVFGLALEEERDKPARSAKKAKETDKEEDE